MPRSLTSSDRASLIRLASSLPKGSPGRKAILAGLSKASYDRRLVEDNVAPPKGKLNAWIPHGSLGGINEPEAGENIWQGTVSANQVVELTEAIDSMWEYGEEEFEGKLEEIEERIRELGYEKEEILLSPLYQKAHAINKKWGLPLPRSSMYDNTGVYAYDSQGRYFSYNPNELWSRDPNRDLKKRG
jgi:hypothetical protein